MTRSPACHGVAKTGLRHRTGYGVRERLSPRARSGLPPNRDFPASAPGRAPALLLDPSSPVTYPSHRDIASSDRFQRASARTTRKAISYQSWGDSNIPDGTWGNSHISGSPAVNFETDTTGNSDVDLKNLKLTDETRISYEQFRKLTNPGPSGDSSGTWGSMNITNSQVFRTTLQETASKETTFRLGNMIRMARKITRMEKSIAL